MEDFAHRSAWHVNELNSIHCFIEVNARTGREWLCLLAEEVGFESSMRTKTDTVGTKLQSLNSTMLIKAKLMRANSSA